MPAPAPFPAGVVNATGSTNNALFPALYLYPLNDTWAPKHIALTNQHTKIGRQTSSKTAPGERNGFFDSKVLSRQHAEVWEENGKIYIKDVKSSNGTFINGERLSSEGHESEPFELKSDDIVEFGIDIVGEDNKTIIHHKVAARVVCVFSEQDAQVAARAEQHQQQQLQQHQFMQQQQQQQQPQQGGSGPGGPGGPGAVNGIGGLPNGIVGGPQNFPFAAQRRAQLAQQGLGSMGGMRPPGKTGLSFDVILSRLQGEVQKSRETGAELNSLTSAMNEIHDTLGGAVPANLPPFPTHLPPVRPPQDAQASAPAAAGSSSASPEQSSMNPAAIVSAAAVVDLQSQLRDTQTSLASHLDKVRALEGVLAEQEAMKREVSSLREMMEERRREMEGLKHREGVEVDERRRTEDHLGEVVSDEEDDDEDDARSISTVMPHELERVEEEDEEQMAEEERRELAGLQEEKETRALKLEEDPIPKADAGAQAAAEAQAEADEQERRREDLDVGRPRTPEPTRMGLRGDGEPYPSRPSLLGAPRRPSLSSPLASSSTSPTSSSTSPPEDVYEQVQRLSKQVSTVLALTTSLEAQHTTAQGTIQVLEGKVSSLEAMLRAAEEALAMSVVNAQTQTVPPVGGAVEQKDVPEKEEDEIVAQPLEVEVEAETTSEKQPSSPSSSPKLPADVSSSTTQEPPHSKESLTAFLAQWKSTVEGQWGSVQSEWTAERERLAKAREEWEAKSRQVEVGLEKMATMQTTLATQQQIIQVYLQQSSSTSHGGFAGLGHHLGLTGDALKHTVNGGLVTPPSPRSQSSDSGRYRRRRRRSSGAAARGRSRGSSGSREEGAGEHEDDVDTDATLASSTEDDKAEDDGKHGIVRALGVIAAAAASVAVPGEAQAVAAARSLATPEPSVYQLSSSTGSLDSSSSAGSPLKGKSVLGNPTRSDTASTDDTHASPTTSTSPQPPIPEGPTISMQTAMGVVLLSVAAAAVFWKVKPE